MCSIIAYYTYYYALSTTCHKENREKETHISHVILDSIFAETGMPMNSVELLRRVNVLSLKVLLVDTELIGDLCTQINYKKTSKKKQKKNQTHFQQPLITLYMFLSWNPSLPPSLPPYSSHSPTLRSVFRNTWTCPGPSTCNSSLIDQ